MSSKELIVKKAGKRGKTKDELTDATGLAYSTVAALVNEAWRAGKLKIVGQVKGDRGRPAPKFARVA